MKKIIAVMLIAFALFAAYSSKPDDKTCIIEAVKFVWGNKVPDVKVPIYYEQFMNLTSQSVVIDDWIFLKHISYRYSKETKTVGFGLFRKVVRLSF